MQSRNRFLNEYENSCIINRLLELNSPGGAGEPVGAGCAADECHAKPSLPLWDTRSRYQAITRLTSWWREDGEIR
jgi:hypothetical protein